MTFDEAFREIVATEALAAFTPAQLETFKIIALSFYKAGEIQGVTNVGRIVAAAAAQREAMDKDAGTIQ